MTELARLDDYMPDGTSYLNQVKRGRAVRAVDPQQPAFNNTSEMMRQAKVTSAAVPAGKPLNEAEEFEFLYQMEQEAKAGIPPPNPAPVKASMGDTIAGTPLARLAMGAASPLIGAAQLGAHVGDAANQAMGVEPMVSPWIDKQLSDYDAARQRGMKASGTEGLDVMGLIGSLAPGASMAKGVAGAMPAAKTALTKILQGAGIGGVTSAAQPVVNSPEFWGDKGKQVGVGAAVGAAVPVAGEVAKAIRGRGPQLNPTTSATLQEGQQAGYVVPPSSVNPSFLNNRLESLAGKAAVGQEAAKRNQVVTNALVKRELGIAQSTPLDEEALNQARKEPGKVYDEVSKLRPPASMEWFPRYHDKDLLEQLKKARADASLAYKSNAATPHPDMLARAQSLEAKADSIDADLEAIAKASGRETLIDALAKARTKFAKSYEYERALNVGDENISATRIGAIVNKEGLTGKSGATATIGRMQQAFPSVMREGARVPASGVSGTDAAAGAILGTLGYGAGGPAGMLAAGLPLLRGPARNLVLSKGYQKFATADPSRFQEIIDALSQQGAGAAGTAAGRGGY